MRFAPVFFLLICWSCSPTPTTKPIIAKADIRYLADQRQLRGNLQLFSGDSLANSTIYQPKHGSVTFMRSVMEPTELPNTVRWNTEMKVDFPSQLQFTFPKKLETPRKRHQLSINFSPPFADSIPNHIDKNRTARFSVGTEPLMEDESIVVFFEPVARNASPRRIVVAGPTATQEITLPRVTLQEVPKGEHGVYLIKQKLARDTLEGVLAATQVSYLTHTVKVIVEGE
ncbi:MAG: hypothetical protein AAFU67_02690 [Bacteroidota bacterium]